MEIPNHNRAHTRGSYATSFREVVDEIDTAVQRAIPSTHRRKYDNVQVLSMIWDNDDRGVKDLASEFETSLRRVYGFAIQHYDIESFGNVAWKFNKKVTQFVTNHAGERNLLIFIYSGHAEAHNDGRDSDWMGRKPQGSINKPRISWDLLRDFANQSPSDVLYILDCCNASAASLDNHRLRKHGNQFLCASGFESTASSNLDKSFTRRLNDVILRHRNTPMSVTSLHDIVWSEALDQATFLAHTPHTFGCGRDGSSIVLEPLATESRELQALRQNTAASHGKVLITVSLEGKTVMPDKATFIKWLTTHVPTNIQNVKVQALFDSHSTVVLATIPFAAWDALQTDPLVEFVAVVESDNLLLPETWKDPGVLSIPLRPKGDENQPFAGPSQKPLR